MEESESTVIYRDSVRTSQQSIGDLTKLVIDQPGFGEDFTTAFGTDLEYIDHTKVGQVIPLKPNEYLDKYCVGKPFLTSGDFTVYEVTGVRQIT